MRPSREREKVSEMKKAIQIVCVAAFVAALGSAASAVNIETVQVGNPGNAGEWSGESYGGIGPDRICGAVDYEYNIGKYEVTAGQYTEFLNAVAGVDTYGLYNKFMWLTGGGCKIERYDGSGTPGDPYQYRVAPDWADRPANYFSWYDTLRFANWLHNGQPTGAQDSSTTEDGSYDMSLGSSVVRKPEATWAVPTEDEWYKAAYHKNDGVTGNYFDYPTSNDSAPSNDLVDPDDPGNNATFYDSDHTFTIGAPHYRTEVGAHENSESPYGTFDQGGNVREWNEAILSGSDRGLRGESFSYALGSDMHASYRSHVYPSYEYNDIGFRVAQVPEPATMSLLTPGGVALVRRRKRGACK